MKLKGFQVAVQQTLGDYLGALVKQRERAGKIALMAAAHSELGLEVPDFRAAAWALMQASGKWPALRAATPFSPSRDGAVDQAHPSSAWLPQHT